MAPSAPDNLVDDRGSCLIDRISRFRTAGIPFAGPKLPFRTTEASLVREVLQMLQGFPSKSFVWEESSQRFHFEDGVHVSHLSQSSLVRLVHRFVCASSSLRKVEAFLKRVATASCNAGPLHLRAPPTLQAFASAVSLRLEHLRKAAVEKELQAVGVGAGTTVTLLSLSACMSCVCAGAEFLEQVVDEAIPHKDILCEGGKSAAELAAYILSFLYKKMSEFCLLQDGEEEPYGTLLVLFLGSLQPLAQSLDAWLHEGILDDPFGELFFYANKSVAIEDAAFWQHGFCLRSLNKVDELGGRFKGAAASVSSSPGLQSNDFLEGSFSSLQLVNSKSAELFNYQDNLVCPTFLQPIAKAILSAGKSLQLLQHVHHRTADDTNSDSLTLTSSCFPPLGSGFHSSCNTLVKQQKVHECNNNIESSKDVSFFYGFWHQWSVPASKGRPLPQPNHFECEVSPFSLEEESCEASIDTCFIRKQRPFLNAPEAPILKTSTKDFHLGLAQCCLLPPLNDEDLREAIFSDDKAAEHSSPGSTVCESSEICPNNQKQHLKASPFLKGTDYSNGSGCGNLLMMHAKLDFRALERLFSLPTMLPSSKEGLASFKLHSVQQQNRVESIMFDQLQKAELKVTPLPEILVQECLIDSIQKQVEAVGKQVLNRLMGEWRLMEELSVLRAVYLIGSGDLLQQFSSVLFNKLDRGEPWDDFYELNTMLQESVRSSADGMLLPALDSLVVTVQPRSMSGAEQGSGPVPLHFAGRNLTFGIDTLDSLFFVYKVAWPLELIIDRNAIKKYNQVMAFLFKIKRSKFALDKACRWMWKNGGGDTTNLKQQLLLQQKLMHFVNTLHQYVMDRVLYSAWVELCEGMASAHSLDEVIVCHDAYLVSIQRQCLVAPDKLWALISSRVKTILGLALDFYSIQRTLCGGGAAPAIKARCQLEIERVGRQFDECIVFLLRVLSFKLNVGHFPHLAELVTRINYNYYYISESGHLLTPLPEISSGRGSQHAKIVGNSHI